MTQRSRNKFVIALGGGGGLPYVVIQGCAIILGTFLGVLSDFWVSFGLFPDFWVSFFVKFDLFWNDRDFWVWILV